MKSYKVGICDNDMEFATAVMDYVNADSSQNINVVIFSGINAVREYLMVYSLDLLLTAESLKPELDEYIRSETEIRYFSEYQDRSGSMNGSGKVSSIYKYQPVSVICKLIRKELLTFDSHSTSVSEVVGVFSPIGRCGKTRLARTLAGYDEVRGGLYLSMETFSERIESLEGNILYLLKTKSSELREALSEGILNEENHSSLYLLGSYMDGLELVQSDFELLKTELLGTGRFTTLVYDIGPVLSDMSILRTFDRIYMPMLRDEASVKKTEVYMEILKRMHLNDVIKKIIPVYVPDADAGSEDMIRFVWGLRNG